MIYHLVGHKILNKTLYYFKRYYNIQILRYLRKCMKQVLEPYSSFFPAVFGKSIST